MPIKPYQPVQKLEFQPDICFLSGQKIPVDDKHRITVFPNWIMDRYNLRGSKIGMLGGNKMPYEEMLLPASDKVVEAIRILDETVEKAFTQGYEGMMKLPELTIFQWMARITYGAIYQDFNYAMERYAKRGREFHISETMERKLSNLHLMLQSLISPVRFDGFCPWSIWRFKVNYSKDIFNYKDDAHKLNFCLGMNGFGILACLQDNGEIKEEYSDIIAQIGTKTIHPIQLEELYARFIYSNYLLREPSNYTLSEENDKVVIHLPENTEVTVEGKPKFAEWEDETFAKVLATAWQPWGIILEKIYHPPHSLISFLIDETTNKLINPESIQQPH